MKKDISVYIHIPFCKSKCFYCDFVSNLYQEEEINLYINSLCKEIKNFDMSLFKIKTLYIGGGTPSFINEQYIYKILSCFELENTSEITIEANPESLNLEKILFYKKIGINRISIGLQTANNILLKKINRNHNLEIFIKSYSDARKYFENINLDLIFALPDQTLEMFYQDIEFVLKIKPEHISIYSLEIKKNNLLLKNKSNFVNEKIERKMYHDAVKILNKSKYYQYEISNFSLKGFESKHNLTYWKLKNYIGFGISAHSFIKNIRYNNTSDFNKYINNPLDSIEKKIKLNKKKLIEEFTFLALRLKYGVSKSVFYKKFNININLIYEQEIKKLVKEKLILDNKKNLKLTRLGFDLANYVMSHFLFD